MSQSARTVAQRTRRLDNATLTDAALYTQWAEDSDVILYIFGAMPLTTTDWIPFQYVKATEPFDVDKVFLRDPMRSWYHFGVPPHTSAVDDTAAFLLDLAISRGSKRIVMIGSSAGGYAAMLHGHLIGADEVHAFAPQSYIDVDNRIRNNDYFMDLHLGPLYETAGVQREYFDLRPLLETGCGEGPDIHIHYCKKHHVDDVNANHIADLPNVFLHQYPEGGHKIAANLRDSGQLTRILEDAINGVTDRRSTAAD